MFHKLADLGFERRPLQAIGFYLSYLLANVIVFGIAGGLTGGVLGLGIEKSFEIGSYVGQTVGVLIDLVIAIAVVRKKEVGFIGLLLVPLSGLLTFYGGAMLGLIPIAYLTTRPRSDVGRSTDS